MKYNEQFKVFTTGFDIDLVSSDKADAEVIQHLADNVLFYAYIYDGVSELPPTSSIVITGQYEYAAKKTLNGILFGSIVVQRSDASTTAYNELIKYAPSSQRITFDYYQGIPQYAYIRYKDPVSGYYAIGNSTQTRMFTNEGVYIREVSQFLIYGDTSTNPYASSYPIVILNHEGDTILKASRFFLGTRPDLSARCSSNRGYNTADNNGIITFLNALGGYEPTVTPDPYSGGGTSGAGGGNGTFDFSSTDIPIPGLPTLSASDTGFISLYNPSASQLESMANYMWAGSFDPNNFKKLFADPMDAILGCHIIPMVSGHPATASAELVIGNISTGLSMPKCTEQYFEVDCGTVQIQPKWGAYLDFTPYTKLSLYLPYIGIVSISPDDCMNGSIRVVYHIDILSGSCCAFVYCNSNNGENPHTLYTFNGSCNCPVPITSGQYVNALVGVVKGGIGLATAAAGLSNGSGPLVNAGLNQAGSAIVSAIKPDITRSGEIGGSAGLMGIQYPYLILTIPKMCIPGEQNVYIGYPSFVTMAMSELTGYTEINISHLNNMSCTEDEAKEIIELLESGVIF